MVGDGEMVDRLRSGDEKAFGELVDRYHLSLVHLAQSVVSSRQVAEEVAQDTWVAAFRGLDGFEGRSSLHTWLYRICVNRARSTAGKEFRESTFDPQEGFPEPSWFGTEGSWLSPVQPWPEAIEDRLDAGALAGRAKEAIEELPGGQRLVVTFRDVEGLSSSEVCEVLSITEANQRVLLHRARSRIRFVLDRYVTGDQC